MKVLMAGMMLVGLLAGQTQLSVTGPASARPGRTVQLTVSYTPAPNVPVAALQWQTTGVAPTAVSVLTPTASAKTVACNLVAPSTKCILYGANVNVLTSGAVALQTVPISTSQSGVLTVNLSGVLAASPTGDAVPVTVGPPLTITIVPPEDVTGDGRIDMIDLRRVVDSALGLIPGSPEDDVNGDGTVNAYDVQRVASKLTP